MRIIVIGAGQLGYEIARLLSEEDHDLIVIDYDEDALQEVSDNLDVLPVHGHGASPMVLEKAGIEKADLLIAVAGPDETNIIACLTAKRFDVPVCAARVRNADYLAGDTTASAHRQLGIDVVVNPEQTAAIEIARILKTPTATHVDYFADGRVSVIGLKVDEGAPITKGCLHEIKPKRCIVAAVVRGDDMFIPRGDAMIQPDDKIYVVCHTGNFAAIRALSGATARRPLRDVTIVGGGRIGFSLADTLSRNNSRGTQIKLIERDPERCEQLAEQLPGVLVIAGDGEKFEVLREEMVERTDAFVAVTGDDGTNLLSTMAAKELGVDETIVSLTREEYVPLAERAGADATIVPRLITASTLLKFVRRNPVVSLALLEEGRAEAVEVVVARGARAIGKRLQDLHIDKGTIIGAIMRRDDVIIPSGMTRIQAGDHLVLFGMEAALPKVEHIFQA